MTELAQNIQNGNLAAVLDDRARRITKGALIGGGIGLASGIFLGRFRGFLTLIGLVSGIMFITSNYNGAKREPKVEGKRN